MNRNNRFSIAGFAVLIAAVGSLALVQAQPQPPKDTKPAAPAVGEPPLPPGWTQEDMEACVKAGTPGSQHAHLAEAVGVWHGKSTMWMTPGAEPMQSECTSTITSIMDGRFTRCEMTGEIPGMGTFNGLGIYGYDNVTQKFQSSWIGNCSTDIMTGVGELSSDGKTLTWVYSHSCPITGKPTTLRDIERRTGPDKMTLETWGADPKSGKEFKMMEVVFTRKPGSAPAGGGG
jgi:hypothetical protein